MGNLGFGSYGREGNGGDESASKAAERLMEADAPKSSIHLILRPLAASGRLGMGAGVNRQAPSVAGDELVEAGGSGYRAGLPGGQGLLAEGRATRQTP